MVSLTIGLIVAAGAMVLATRQITEHRRLMLEVQIQQDLRVAADLLQQELRRAGYRGLPANGVWEPEHAGGTAAAKPAAASPYTLLTQTPGGNDLFYRYARPAGGTMNTSNVLADNEQFGIRLRNSVLYLQLGLANGKPNWQPVTDPDIVKVVNFVATIHSQSILLDDLCNCPAGSACQTLTVRRVDLSITGVAKSDSTVRRTLNVTERVPADDISGVCPT